MNAERLRPAFLYSGRLTGIAVHEGIVWKFQRDRCRPRRRYFLAYETKTRKFFALIRRHNGHGTITSFHLPKRVAALLRSILPDEEIARAFTLSLTYPRE